MSFFLSKNTLFFINILFILIFININQISSRRTGVNQSHKGQSRLERKYIECQSTPRCSYRSNDEECIYKCVNEKCFNELIIEKGLFLEYGEINKDFKKDFEECTNRNLTRKRHS